jgi:hypothetical protein
MWIKAEKPVEKTGKVTSQAQKKKHLSPSTRKRNALCISQWKAKRYEAVEDIKTCAKHGRHRQFLCLIDRFLKQFFL